MRSLVDTASCTHMNHTILYSVIAEARLESVNGNMLVDLMPLLKPGFVTPMRHRSVAAVVKTRQTSKRDSSAKSMNWPLLSLIGQLPNLIKRDYQRKKRDAAEYTEPCRTRIRQDHRRRRWL
jgi:hypothetical protein